MKWCKYFIALLIFASARVALAQLDTFDLAGGTAGWGIGWFGEAWRDTAWCGDTLKRDTSIFLIETLTVMDTLTNTPNTVIDTQKTITKTVLNCSAADFETDTGGFYPGAMYINYYYKFRNYWAQLPFVWTNWQGYDSIGTSIYLYKYFMIVYEGLLPIHQASLSFFYGTWGMDSVTRVSDSIKNATGAGDGVVTLYSSPTWKTVIIKIPDSVSLARIDGLTIAIANITGQGDKTSVVGNLKVARVSLLLDTVATSVKYRTGPNKANNRYVFTPAGGNVTITAFSLKGEALLNKKVTVQAGMQYSVRQFVLRTLGLSASQVRMVKIKGEGVNVTTRIW